MPHYGRTKNKIMERTWKSKALAILMMMTAISMSTSCSMIDDDLDDCEVELKGQYRLHLVTNEELEIKRVLGHRDDIAGALREYLSDVFTDYGRDLALSFYALPDSVLTLPLRGQLPTEMNATERSFDIFMPISDYMHLATANVRSNGPVSLEHTESCRHAALRPAVTAIPTNMSSYLPADLDAATPSQRTGLFTGRRALSGLTYGPQQYDMPLYIANSAAAIVLDPRTARFTDVRIFTTGFADGFSISDSTYTYTTPYLVRADRVTVGGTNWLCYCGVSLPSRELADLSRQQSSPSTETEGGISTRSRVEIDEPVFDYRNSGRTIWYYDCYVTLATGSVTRTTIGIPHPLRAGQLKIIVGWIDDDGIIRLEDQELSVSSDLDWQEGLIIRY